MIINCVKQGPFQFGPDYLVCQTAQNTREVGTVLASLPNKSKFKCQRHVSTLYVGFNSFLVLIFLLLVSVPGPDKTHRLCIILIFILRLFETVLTVFPCYIVSASL